MAQLLTVSPDFNRKYSDARFILRLVLSWLIFFTVWFVVIFGSVAVVSTVLVFVGHQVNYYTGFGDLPNVNVHLLYADHTGAHIFLDGMIGLISVALSAGIVGAIILIFFSMFEYHYLVWEKQQNSYIITLQAASEKPDDELLGSFADLDNGKRNFWKTIPEYVKLESGFKYYVLKNINRCLPYTTLRRYFAVLFLDISIDLIVSVIWVLFTTYLGSFCTTHAMLLDDHGNLLPLRAQNLLNWAIGLMMEVIIGILGWVCWIAVIDPSIKEWQLYQAKKLQALNKRL